MLKLKLKLGYNIIYVMNQTVFCEHARAIQRVWGEGNMVWPNVPGLRQDLAMTNQIASYLLIDRKKRQVAPGWIVLLCDHAHFSDVQPCANS